ncbi:MAG: DUF72 domain-containing protein [Acidobacteria bacterium]|nr:DUF72 domain-containing protein [Acidobacteriota bacterium]
MTKPLVKAGCCGFRAAQSEYTALFSVVEVQQTFYQPPQVETLRRWREAAPKNFEFTLKAWQLITHAARSPTYKRLKRKLTEEEREECGAFRPTPIVREAWDMTRACAEALKAKRVLFQCPASFTPSPENLKRMRAFFSTVERRKLKFCWEPRGGWPDKTVRDLCDELDLVHVVDPFAARTVTTSRERYFRLHGRGGWRYQYETGELEELLTMLPRGKTSYVLFNNVRMLEDAARLQELAQSEAD